jgi:hypothetical protein
MCWNQYVSINTFIFGIFVLLLVALNNEYSSYKIDLFKNPYAYIFILSVISMQFFEFLLWRNINNPLINNIVSTFGLILLAIQPFMSLLLINNIKLRNNLLFIYSVPTLIFLIYTISTTNIHTKISKSGHLAWYWTNSNVPLLDIFALIFYLIFLFFPVIYNKYYTVLLFLLVFFIIKHYYDKDKSSNSLWCFFVNIIMLYFLAQILLVLPLNEIVSNKKKF